MRSAVALLLLASCGGDFTPDASNQWDVGPTINGKNYSTGSISGNVLTVRDVHYVTKATGPLSGTLSLRFHLDAPLTGTMTPENGCGPAPATASLYFQRDNDNWATDGNRWWATFATVTLDHAGDYTMTAPMDGPWTSVQDMTAALNPQVFADAKVHAARVGFTLGNCTGYGHGGSGPANLTITDWASSL